jgi:hypothetical protein
VQGLCTDRRQYTGIVWTCLKIQPPIPGYYSGEEEAGEDCPLVKGRPSSQSEGEEVEPIRHAHLLNITHMHEITFADD